MARDNPLPAVLEAETIGAVQPHVVVLSAPRTAAAEQYRVLRQRLEPAIARGAKRIGFTSAVAGEGKSTTAVNLALALGMGGRHKVALVDANLRAPGVHALLGLSAQQGLVDVVEERISLDQALWRFRSDQLYVLPAGRTLDAYAIFAARRLGAVLAELRDRFDVVIVDAPPVMPTADMLTLATELDGAVMVIRAGETPRELVRHALAALPELRLLGCVLHRVETAVSASFRLFARHDRQVAQPLLPAPAPARTAKG
jgi:capsular exopolysaccharide synthesis family protein